MCMSAGLPIVARYFFVRLHCDDGFEEPRGLWRNINAAGVLL